MIFFLIFVTINIVLAKIDAIKIAKQQKIKHGINALIYLGLLIPVFLITYNWLLIIGLLLVRIPVFNTALNYFRGLPLTYISDSTTSIIDQITNFIPKKIGYWPYSIVLFLTSLTLSLWQN